jgi:hypothetical protein
MHDLYKCMKIKCTSIRECEKNARHTYKCVRKRTTYTCALRNNPVQSETMKNAIPLFFFSLSRKILFLPPYTGMDSLDHSVMQSAVLTR